MKPQNILLIDDDPDEVDFFRGAVNGIDATIVVEYVPAGEAAIELLLKRVSDTLPDIVFMDVNMPVMNGWETLREIKRLLANFSLPIVMFSTMSFENVAVSPADLGAAAFMTKADSLEKLENGLRTLFNSLYE